MGHPALCHFFAYRTAVDSACSPVAMLVSIVSNCSNNTMRMHSLGVCEGKLRQKMLIPFDVLEFIHLKDCWMDHQTI